MTLRVKVETAGNAMVSYKDLDPALPAETEEPGQVFRDITGKTASELEVHLQSKVAAGQEVGDVTVVASGAAGNFGGYMFSVTPASVTPPTPTGVTVTGLQRAVLVRWSELVGEPNVQTTVVRLRLAGGGATVKEERFRHADTAGWLDQITASTSEDATVPAALEALVKHRDTAGNESAWSAAVAVTPEKSTVDVLVAEKIIGDLFFGNKGIFGDLTVAGVIKNAGILPFGAGALWFGQNDPPGGEMMIANGRTLNRVDYPEAAEFYSPVAPGITSTGVAISSSRIFLTQDMPTSLTGYYVTGPGVPAGTKVLSTTGPSNERYLTVDKPVQQLGSQTYGFSLSSGTFTIPNIQGVFVLGASTAYPLGSAGGAAEHTLTEQQMPAHNHRLSGAYAPNTTANNPGPRIQSLDSPYDSNRATQGQGRTEGTGGGQPHNNMPPYKAYNWIVRVK